MRWDGVATIIMDRSGKIRYMTVRWKHLTALKKYLTLLSGMLLYCVVLLGQSVFNNRYDMDFLMRGLVLKK
jgi:hypothetical protein